MPCFTQGTKKKQPEWPLIFKKNYLAGASHTIVSKTTCLTISLLSIILKIMPFVIKYESSSKKSTKNALLSSDFL